MHFSFKQAITAFSLGAMTLTGIAATPALAQPGRDAREYRRDVRDAQQDRRRDVRDARQDYRKDVRDARKDYRRDVKDDRRDWRQDRRANNRPNRVVYNYDYNRPDPRYGRTYQPNRYYRSGYAPVRVDRNTRIYRGADTLQRAFKQITAQGCAGYGARCLENGIARHARPGGFAIPLSIPDIAAGLQQFALCVITAIGRGIGPRLRPA